MSELALFGGKPVRIAPFRSSAVIDSSEWGRVQDVLKREEFSRFMGSPTPDIDEILAMTSEKAMDIGGQYFSFLGGHMVRQFEAEFARKFGVAYAISVNSATSGLAATLGALDVGPGDEVITSCMSFNATAMSILVFNAIPVFVDVEDETYCMNPAVIEKAITNKTKAILVVHLLGNAAEMDAIMGIARKHHLRVIEDAAQAPGTIYSDRYVGTIGDIGVYSFQETKNMMTGEGGMIVTNDLSLARKARLIRNHGESIPDETWDDGSIINLVGLNFRMTELTAALGSSQLEKLDENNHVRKDNALFLKREMEGIPGISLPAIKEGTVPHIFSVLYDETETGIEREKILAALRAEGIPVGSGYLRLMYENPLFLKRIAYGKNHCPWSCHLYGRNRVYANGDCPVGEELLRRRFIWFYHINRPNTAEDMRDVSKAFKKVFSNLDRLSKAEIDFEIPYKW